MERENECTLSKLYQRKCFFLGFYFTTLYYDLVANFAKCLAIFATIMTKIAKKFRNFPRNFCSFLAKFVTFVAICTINVAKFAALL